MMSFALPNFPTVVYEATPREPGAGSRAFRAEFDLASGHIHALVELDGPPMLPMQVLQVGRWSVVSFWAHDLDDARRILVVQRNKRIKTEDGYRAARSTEAVVENERTCSGCGCINGHLENCPADRH